MSYKNNINNRAYKYKCLKCGNTDQLTESVLLRGCGCNVCGKSPKKVLKGVNDIATTCKWMLPYFIDINDAYLYTSNSTVRLDFKCPECGQIKNIKINNLFCRGFCCPKCGDGKSYPEKLMFSVLEQLEIKFNMQLAKNTFDWCSSYKYDFYIPSLNCIIETNGAQHYEEGGKNSIYKHKLIKIQENDKTKHDLAVKNGIKEENYIVIDCRESKLEFIKNNIINTILSKIFNLSIINWKKCEEYACNSLVKTACDIFNQGIINTSYIAQIMKLERSTIYHYLQIGTEIGWCCYDKSIISKLQSLKSASRARKILCLDNNLIFNSCAELECQSLEIFGTFLRRQSISRICKGVRTNYKGFHFEYK
jgi:Zn finger protein HypA/HybF involved in hydrogenase expression/very-short-patch-repair endonuclease